jgi:hypothetical protein
VVGSRITTATATTGTQAAVTTGTQAAVATATAATTAVTATINGNGNGNTETRQPRDLSPKLTCCPWVQHDLVYERRHGIGRGQDLHGRRPDLDV